MPEAESRLPWLTAQRLHGDECNLLPRHMIATERVKGKARVRPAKAAAEGNGRPRAAEKRAAAKKGRGEALSVAGGIGSLYYLTPV